MSDEGRLQSSLFAKIKSQQEVYFHTGAESVVSSQWSVVSGQLSVVSSQWSVSQ